MVLKYKPDCAPLRCEATLQISHSHKPTGPRGHGFPGPSSLTVLPSFNFPLQTVLSSLQGKPFPTVLSATNSLKGIYKKIKSIYLTVWSLSCGMQDLRCIMQILSLQHADSSCDPRTPELTSFSCCGSSVHGIVQARILEWIVISSP